MDGRLRRDRGPAPVAGGACAGRATQTSATRLCAASGRCQHGRTVQGNPLVMLDRLRRIGVLAAPTALVAILQVVGQLAETWLAARQGTAALAGWATALPFVLLMQMMSTGAMGGGVVSAIARALGAGQREDASAMVLHAALIAIGAGLLFAIPLAVFPHAILGAIGGAAAADAAAPYAMWLFGLGAVPVWLTNTLASVLRGGGRHALAARVLVLAWLVLPFMYIAAVGAGFFASYLAVVQQIGEVSSGGFFLIFWMFQNPPDLLYSVLKGMFMATAIVLVGCYYGYNASGGPVGVGTATAKSMVLNIVMVHLIGMLGTQIFWGANPRAPIGG